MTLATVVIPVSPKHKQTGYYLEAVASVEAQTVPTQHIVVFDDERRGAGWARNVGTAQVQTPFVIYLDADDTLSPEFVEQTARYYEPGKYVYTDWRHVSAYKDVIRLAPDKCCIMEKHQQHVTTTLLPVAAWRMVDGFDESLRTLEDEDFYKKLCIAGWGSVRCPLPLVVYNRKRGDSLVNEHAHDLDVIEQRVQEYGRLLDERYGALKMGCNCVSPGDNKAVKNEPQEGWVLVTADYTPMTRVGPATKIKYPRAGLGQRIYVHPDDAAARPDWWPIVNTAPVEASPSVAEVRAQAVRTRVPLRPDFKRVLQLAQAGL